MRRLHDLLFENQLCQDRLIGSILLVAVALSAVSLAYSRLFTYPAFTELLIDATKNDAVRAATHFGARFSGQTEPLRRDVLDPTLPAYVEQMKDDFGLMKAKLYSSSGEVLLSTDPGEVGTVNRRPYFHETVARGQVYAAVVWKDTESRDGPVVTADVLETYVPLMHGRTFLGAFEVYYDITTRKRRLDDLLLHSSILVWLLTFGLLTAVATIVLRGYRSLAQRKRLEDERSRRERLQGVIEMAGAACHELNQPVQTILGHSELLLATAPPDAAGRESIRTIKQQVDRLRTITAKIMSITRYETLDYAEGVRIIDINKASEDPDT